jgi:ABC-type molybdate transport system substrate-binding protein
MLLLIGLSLLAFNPAAIIQASRHPALGEAFIELLLGHAGQMILGRLGFQPPTGVKP